MATHAAWPCWCVYGVKLVIFDTLWQFITVASFFSRCAVYRLSVMITYVWVSLHLSVQWWTVNLLFITHLMKCLIWDFNFFCPQVLFVIMGVPRLLNCLIAVLHEQQLGKHQGVNSLKCCHVIHRNTSCTQLLDTFILLFFTIVKSSKLLNNPIFALLKTFLHKWKQAFR